MKAVSIEPSLSLSQSTPGPQYDPTTACRQVVSYFHFCSVSTAVLYASAGGSMRCCARPSTALHAQHADHKRTLRPEARFVLFLEQQLQLLPNGQRQSTIIGHFFGSLHRYHEHGKRVCRRAKSPRKGRGQSTHAPGFYEAQPK